MNNAQATQIEDGVRELHARIAELTTCLELIEVDLTAGDMPPKGRVTLALSRVRAALAAVGEKK